MRRRTFGIVKACTKASVTQPAPKTCAITKSRAAPRIREKRVKIVTVRAFFRMRPDSSGLFFKGMNVKWFNVDRLGSESRPRQTCGQLPKIADLPSSDSISSKRLYFAMRSLREAEPVLICPPAIATAKSAINVSSVSPLRCEII